MHHSRATAYQHENCADTGEDSLKSNVVCSYLNKYGTHFVYYLNKQCLTIRLTLCLRGPHPGHDFCLCGDTHRCCIQEHSLHGRDGNPPLLQPFATQGSKSNNQFHLHCTVGVTNTGNNRRARHVGVENHTRLTSNRSMANAPRRAGGLYSGLQFSTGVAAPVSAAEIVVEAPPSTPSVPPVAASTTATEDAPSGSEPQGDTKEKDKTQSTAGTRQKRPTELLIEYFIA